MTDRSRCPAIVAAENAVAAAREMYGDRHPQVAVALIQLAQEHGWLKQWDAAEQLLREALAIEQERAQPHAARVAGILRRLAVLGLVMGLGPFLLGMLGALLGA